LCADKSIKPNPSTSLLTLSVGDEVLVTEDGFQVQPGAFISAIEARFV
jgi:hypothetical protein